MIEDPDRCYRAIAARDARFDGWFVTAVTSTGIYCRPSCPAVTPKRENVRFYATAAAAQGAGFRACKRCRPDAAPGSPEWNVRSDVVARAMRLIGDGVVDRVGVRGLAAELGYSERHLHRLLVAELGAGPLALARAQRAQTARILIETTALPFSAVAFAAGFASIRQFNDVIRAVFAGPPTALRRGSRFRHAAVGGGDALELRLAHRRPYDAAGVFGFLATRAIPGVEAGGPDWYARTLALPHGSGSVHLSPGDSYIRCRLQLDDLRDLTAAVQRCRRLLDLDADPEAVHAHLAGDELLGRLVVATPGRRVPGTVDPHEIAVRAVLGQQVSVAGARTTAARLVAAYGKPRTAAGGPDALTHEFPSAATLATLDPAALPLPAARGRALVGLADALASGRIALTPAVEPDELRRRLTALPGIGIWTADYVALRALGHPDVLLPGDLGVRRALAAVGAASSPKAVVALAERWRPWRSYAMAYLWNLPTTTRST